LSKKRLEIETGTWLPSVSKHNSKITFKQYALEIIKNRDLRENTYILYHDSLHRYVFNVFGNKTMNSISYNDIRNWYYSLDRHKQATRQKVYMIVKMIFTQAVLDNIIKISPCKIKNTQSKLKRVIKPANINEIKIIVDNMPEKLKLMILLSCFCALRYGEVAEIRKKDIDIKNKILNIERAVTFIKGKAKVDIPKTEKSIRVINIPPHIIPNIKEHLIKQGIKEKDDLLFASKVKTHLSKKNIIRYYNKAKEKANRTDLTFHDLRHTGAVFTVYYGNASTYEVMDKLGHTTPKMAMNYQHIIDGRQKEIAENISKHINKN
jgi:integrase